MGKTLYRLLWDISCGSRTLYFRAFQLKTLTESWLQQSATDAYMAECIEDLVSMYCLEFSSWHLLSIEIFSLCIQTDSLNLGIYLCVRARFHPSPLSIIFLSSDIVFHKDLYVFVVIIDEKNKGTFSYRASRAGP